MTLSKPVIARVRRIGLVTADLKAAETFFTAAFEFVAVERAHADPGLAALLGLPNAHVRQTIMRLGEQEIGLLAFDPPGRPIAEDGTSTDLWFQHFAIIVSDMDAAYARLRAVGGYTPISEGGPQVLPPTSGSVSAFKFRDAEGHPLELLAFPKGEEPEVWRDKASQGVFLGIDHSAIAVADTERSVAFYQSCFGLRLGPRTENTGPEQARLDAVPNAAVTVAGLEPAAVATPHVELLGYHVGSRRPMPEDMVSNDGAASFFVMESGVLGDVAEALTRAGARFISPGITRLANGSDAIAVLDPDGHRIVITG